MRVLFLDDNPERLKKAKTHFVGEELTLTETAQQTINALNNNPPFDLVSIDHDLGGKVYCESDENSGYWVAKHISEMPSDKLPDTVIIHSYNPVGVRRMYETLKPIVDKTYCEPFNFV